MGTRVKAGNGNTRTLGEPPRTGGVPNGLKLSDGGWRRKTWTAEKTPQPASVRWSAWLARAYRATRTGTSVDSGGGMTGAAAGKG